MSNRASTTAKITKGMCRTLAQMCTDQEYPLIRHKGVEMGVYIVFLNKRNEYAAMCHGGDIVLLRQCTIRKGTINA